MTEEESAFDPTLKKKKKKKKTFDLDAAVAGEDAPADNKNEEADEAPEDDLDLENFGKKKKKKKKVLDDEDDEEKGANDNDDFDLESFGKKKKKKKARDPMNMDDLEDALPNDDDDDVDMTFGKKKKKKKRGGDLVMDDDAGDDKENEEANPWVDSDRVYTYDELVERVFNIMRDKNPEMVAGEKKKF